MTKYYELLRDSLFGKKGMVFKQKDNGIFVSLNKGSATQLDPRDILDFNQWFKEVVDRYELNYSFGWHPGGGNKFYYTDIVGNVVSGSNDNTKADRKIIMRGGARRTREEAEKDEAIRKACYIIHNYMYTRHLSFNPDFSDASYQKWQITGWNYEYDEPETDVHLFIDNSKHSLIFESSEDMDRVLRTFPDELKLILKRW